MIRRFIFNRWTHKSARDLPPELWLRDWEFLYRAADLLWAMLGDGPDIFERRLKYIEQFGFAPTRCSDIEAARYADDFQPVCAWITERWCRLFDQWSLSRDQFVFDDGFAVLFLLRLLWANDTVLLRGHYDAVWRLTSTQSRAQERGTNFLKNAQERGQQFLEQLKRLSIVQSHYGRRCPSNTRQQYSSITAFPRSSSTLPIRTMLRFILPKAARIRCRFHKALLSWEQSTRFHPMRSLEVPF